jgi:HlyD family secretion protein
MRRIWVVAVGMLGVSGCRDGQKPDAYGNIEAIEVVVGSQAAGQLVSFVPNEGDKLSVGAPVATIDTIALSLQREQVASQRSTSASRVIEVGKQLGVLEAQRAIAARNYERMRRLFEQQAATAQQLDQAERDYRTLLAQMEAVKAQRQTAEQDVASSEARVAQIRDQIQKARIVNPVAGTVLATFVKPGEIVQNGQPLYRIANLDTVELRAFVTEPQLAQVRLGKTVQVSIDAGASRRTRNGVVSWVASQAEFTPTPIETRDERTNLVYAIKVRVPNTDGALKIGMPADVQLAPVVAAR